MNIVFCGTPAFAVPALRALLQAADFSVRLVVCQPDRPSGRGMELTAPPTKRLALERGIPVAQPERIKNNDEFRELLEDAQPEAIAVVAYGRILPPWMLALPPLGNINLHASLLPKYRGAAPVQWAIANGESVTGNTTMRLDEGLDTGDILLRQELAISDDDTSATLLARLAEAGAPLLVETLRRLQAGTITPTPQDHRAATPAPPLKKEDGQVDFRRTASEIANRLRGFTPWPGAYTAFRGKTLNLWQLRPATAPGEPLAPGELRSATAQLFVGCGGATALEIVELQPQGKRRLSARDFLNGYRPQPGERLG
jgi:methionyl-tRNA formyltransferase